MKTVRCLVCFDVLDGHLVRLSSHLVASILTPIGTQVIPFGKPRVAVNRVEIRRRDAARVNFLTIGPFATVPLHRYTLPRL